MTVRMLHDPAIRSALETRLNALTPDSPRRWGRMTSDQMLWHVNQFLTFSLGDGSPAPPKSTLFSPVMRFFLIYMPWPKGAPTNPKARATERYDFAVERARCLALIDRFVKKPLDEPWPVDPSFGKATGKFASGLQARHLDHHFRQFGA
jgi:hypothetical protein